MISLPNTLRMPGSLRVLRAAHEGHQHRLLRLDTTRRGQQHGRLRHTCQVVLPRWRCFGQCSGSVQAAYTVDLSPRNMDLSIWDMDLDGSRLCLFGIRRRVRSSFSSIPRRVHPSAHFWAPGHVFSADSISSSSILWPCTFTYRVIVNFPAIEVRRMSQLPIDEL